MKIFEPHFEERVKLAQARAQRVMDGAYDPADGEDGVLFVLRWIICQHWNIPVFDPYFEKRTLDDLAFEVELIRLSKAPSDARTSEILKDAPKKELDALTDDWADEDQAILDKQFQEDAMKFMQGGNFKGEDK